MNKNVLIVLAGGFLVAVFVAVLVQMSLGGGSKSSADMDTTQILVAAKALKVGSVLREGDLKWQVWPEDSVFKGAVVREGDENPSDIMNGKMLRSLTIGQPLHSSLVAEDGKGNFLSANVDEGMRGVGVEVTSSVVGDRLFKPGDFVDVIVTYRLNIDTRATPDAVKLVNRFASETVIENVRILAVDNNDTKAIDEEEDSGSKKKQKSARKATVTLEVEPEGAEKLALANKLGDVTLALRAIGDNSAPEGDRTITDVGMSRVMTQLSKMNGTTSSGVRIYNGIQTVDARPRSVEEPEEKNFEAQANDEEETQTTTIEIDTRTLEGLINEE